MASQSLKMIDQNLEGLFNCPWFHGELSREDATEILNEAVANDGESELKMIYYLETDPWGYDIAIGKKRFATMLAIRSKGPDDIQPKFHFTEIQEWNWISLVRNWVYQTGSTPHYVERKNPFSLQVLATVKAASCNLETQQLPTRIEEEVQRYQDLNGAIKANWHYKLKFIKPTRK